MLLSDWLTVTMIKKTTKKIKNRGLKQKQIMQIPLGAPMGHRLTMEMINMITCISMSPKQHLVVVHTYIYLLDWSNLHNWKAISCWKPR